MWNVEFFVSSLIVILMPGVGVIYTVSNGLFTGHKASIAAACGCTAGIIPHLSASILGLAAILHVSAVAFQTVKFAGALYLLYLGWAMWRNTGTFKFDTPQQMTFRRIAVRGFLINILNPKLSIFFLAFLPLFVQPNSIPASVQMVYHGLGFMFMTLIVFSIYGLSATAARRYVIASPVLIARMRRACAVAFAGLGLKLALSDR